MQEILQHMRSNGLEPPELALDGKVHRFQIDNRDKKKSGWYCGFQNFSSSTAKPFYVVRYSNFQIGEVHQFQSEGDYSSNDIAVMKKAMAKAKKESELERERIQEQSAKECEEKWNLLRSQESPPSSNYLNSKGHDSSFRSLSDLTAQGVCTFVPMRDVQNKLWGLQKIEANGVKRFYPGARVQGCFHICSIEKEVTLDEQEIIYIAEGFATSASCALALGKPVVCAFQSNNLLSVSKALKGKYPDKAFVLCGDDDIYTVIKYANGKEEKKNPGRLAAEEAAKAVLGKAIFPQFPSNSENLKYTDFNDLHKNFSIESVTEQLTNVETERHYVIALGYDSGDYFFISNVNPQIQRLSAGQLTSSGLCRLQPLHYWEAIYPGAKTSIDWGRAADELMQACHAKGIFRPDRVRGRGVWIDQGRVIFHRGTHLGLEDQEFPLHRNELKSRYIYELSEEMPPLDPNPLTVEDCQALLNACALIRWKQRESFMFLSGWLAVAPMGGALQWRPHIWVTGPSGSGKSYIMQEIIFPLLRDHSRYFRGATTEAGIRQKVGSSTLPVIFDEFETNDEHSASRIRSILELARQASSDSDGVVAKGTVSGNAIEFRPQFSMVVGSVRLNLIHVEDQNRFAVLKLAGAKAGEGKDFDNLKHFVSKLGDDYGRRLFSRMVSLAIPLRDACKCFQTVIGESYSIRIGQQYGALLAGYWMLQSDISPTPDQARTMCAQIDFQVAKESVDRLDEEECRDHLLTRKVSIEIDGHRQDFAVSEAILNARFDQGIGAKLNEALQRLGIKVFPNGGDGIAIAGNGHAELESAFYRGSKWSKNWIESLSRLPGTEAKVTWMSQRSTRGLVIPYSSLGLI